MTAPARLRFVSPKQDTEGAPLPMDVVMRDAHGEEVEQSFLCKPKGTVSFGQVAHLLDGNELKVVLGAFRVILQSENSAPRDAKDKRTEYQRFEEFVADPNLYIEQDTLLKMMNAVIEEYAGGPTGRPSASTPTPRNGPVGAARRPRKRA